MALKGIKVIEFAGLAPGPFCGKVLKDLGANVIRIDKTGVKLDLDRLSHGKKSISINLKEREGIEIVKKLSDGADVLIEPFRKGVMERLGLSPRILCASNPKLIYARLSGYGHTGELSEKAGHDINYIGYSGVLSVLGRANEKPHAPINLIADFAGGGLMCALAIVTALFDRLNKKKGGTVIDCSMVEGASYLSSWLWTSKDIPGVWEGGKRGTNLLDGGYFAYDTYETKDKKYMACGALEPQFYENLKKGLGLSKKDEINKDVLETIFRSKTQKEWVEIFEAFDACVSPVLDLDEAPKLNHSHERKSFIKTDNGSYLPSMSWLNINYSEVCNKLPQTGEHTIDLLKDLGYSESEINELIKKNVIEIASLKSKI